MSIDPFSHLTEVEERLGVAKEDVEDMDLYTLSADIAQSGRKAVSEEARELAEYYAQVTEWMADYHEKKINRLLDDAVYWKNECDNLRMRDLEAKGNGKC